MPAAKSLLTLFALLSLTQAVNAQPERPAFTLPISGRSVQLFAPQGQHLLAFETDTQRLLVWDWKQQKRLKQLQLERMQDYTPLYQLEFSQNHKTLLLHSQGFPGRFLLFDAQNYQLRSVIQQTPAQPTGYQPYALSPDGRYLSVSERPQAPGQSPTYDVDVWINVFDTHSGRKVQRLYVRRNYDELPGHVSSLALAYHPNGRYLSVGIESKLLKVWDIRRRRWVASYPGDYSLSYSSQGHYFAFSTDQELRLWDLKRQRIRHFKGEQMPLNPGFSPDETWLAYSDASIPGVRVLSLTTHKSFKLPAVQSFSFSPDSRFISYISRTEAEFITDHQHLLDLSTGRELLREKQFISFDQSPSLCFSPDGRYYAYRDQQQQIFVRELATQRQLLSLSGRSASSNPELDPRYTPTSFSFTPDSQYLMLQAEEAPNLSFWSFRAP